jgi:hypothetical protein
LSSPLAAAVIPRVLRIPAAVRKFIQIQSLVMMESPSYVMGEVAEFTRRDRRVNLRGDASELCQWFIACGAERIETDPPAQRHYSPARGLIFSSISLPPRFTLTGTVTPGLR